MRPGYKSLASAFPVPAGIVNVMRHALSAALIFVVFSAAVPPANAADSVSRRDAFSLIWKSTSRPAESTRETPYIDVKKGSAGYEEITYAKARGILSDEQDHFYPDSPVSPSDALRWILRTRSVEPVREDGSRVRSELPEIADVPALAELYGVAYDHEGESMTRDQLIALMKNVDDALQSEVHEVSLYAEDFQGAGTAFGEKFDMNALTAAHRTFPYNTLVRVTNVDNGKTVVVRINDRGPFVNGRDMDLSLAAFTSIAERSLGKINVRFERLGDVNIVRRCNDDRFQRRIVRDVVLSPGIPHSFQLGATLRLTSPSPFVVRNVWYPDGTETGVQTWVTKDEAFEMRPSVTGVYRFLMGAKDGRGREMRMEVVDCSDH